ncbi:MAG: hypothetical protein A2047_01005 [Omnitrophica bacterium GWA2_41_15]|nr:MAG: hypothetical protein A2047_01005 [Omnitrophica bacterium GWA2_41_15]
MHNAAYRALGIDYLYKAVCVSDPAAAIAAVRTLGIRGCSVSMPFKQSVITYLDDLDTIARRIGAVNTIVNDNGYLTGFNTDVIGAHKVLETLVSNPKVKILMLGSGGIARAILVALESLGISDVRVSSRNLDKAEQTVMDLGIGRAVPWEQRESEPADILINATPIGMSPDDSEMPVTADWLCCCSGVMDVVAMPPNSLLVRTSRMLGIKATDGLTMALHQAVAQFKLYTGCEPPLEIMRDAALSLLADGNKFSTDRAIFVDKS